MFYLYFFFVLGCSALYENCPYVIHPSKEELSGLLENPDYMAVDIIYDRNGMPSKVLSNVIVDVLDKYHTFVKVYAYDCADDEQLCPENIKAELPIFEAHVPAGLNPYTGKPLVHKRKFEGEIAYKEVSDFLLTNIPFLGEVLNKENEDFLNENQLNHAILFSSKEKAPLIFKALSSEFRGRLEFWVSLSSDPEYSKTFGVTEYPTLMVRVGEDMYKYTGKYDFFEISKFLDQFAAKERQELKLKKKKPKEEKKEEPEIPQFPILDLDSNNFKEKLEGGKLAIVHFYKESQVTEWEEIKKNYNGVVLLANFQCKNEAEEEFAKSLGVKKFPSLRIFPINRKRKSLELVFSNQYELEYEISRELKVDIISLSDSNINAFVNQVGEEQKVGLLYLTETTPNLHFKGLASDPAFKDFVKFGSLNKPPEQAKQIFNQSRYPTIIAFSSPDEKGDFNLLEFTGNLNDYAAMSFFLDKQAIPYMLKREISPTVDVENADIVEFKHKNYEKACTKKIGMCVIGFFEGNPENTPQFSVLKKVSLLMEKRKIPFHFGWVDGICQHELRESFGISEAMMPNLAVYFPHKQKSARLVGTFNEDDINSFLEGVTRGKISTDDKAKIKVIDRDCEAFHNSLKQNTEEGHDELIEEVLKEEEEKKKALGVEEGTSKKGKRRKRKGVSKADDL
ncbi:PDILT_2 [Blepharisma stoltei]|uniref:Thioredoxin domain-containing protein n=1 Tax=Blepharisma stoltei TaxID=1481888 RepID=A0AAU9JU48_9CILI|nr:unnamed protein product [Blepharisma stoltei]